MTEREIIICRDVDELNHKAAERFVALAGEAISQSGQFTVALSGGSTPKGLYALIATPKYRNRVRLVPRSSFLGRRALRPAGSPRE